MVGSELELVKQISGLEKRVTVSPLQERKRVIEQFPEMRKLNDEEQLRGLLKSAREKFGQGTKDPFPFNPEAFTRKKSD